jgi:hypothetical protein
MAWKFFQVHGEAPQVKTKSGYRQADVVMTPARKATGSQSTRGWQQPMGMARWAARNRCGTGIYFRKLSAQRACEIRLLFRMKNMNLNKMIVFIVRGD